MTRHKTEHFRIQALKRTYNHKTNTFTYNITYETAPATQTERTRNVAEAFGLGADNTQHFTLYDNISLHIRPTDIVLITGDSGSGKSALLRAIKTDLGAAAQDPRDLHINPDTPIIDTIGKNTQEALELLSKVGLNDAFLFLRTYAQLSDGQKHRYQIARLAETPVQWWMLDEFTSTLDRDTAKIVAYNLQKHARALGKAVIAATTHTDIKADLSPNVHVHKRYGKELRVSYNPHAKAQHCSLTRQTRTAQGTIADYKPLSQFHYRTAQLPPHRKIFTLKRKNETVGVIVYSYPPLVCFGRSKVWKGTLAQLQKEISTISRVIIHPKYRSIGLGAKLVAETLPQAETPCVEAVAVTARYNPFFEKAGMQRIAESKPSTPVTNALAQLHELGFDTNMLASTEYCKQKITETGHEKILAILEALSRSDAAVRRRLARLSSVYPKHEEFMAKLSAIGTDALALTLKRLSFIAQTKVYLFWRNQSA
ncbi:MAG: ABC transporter ATP-binding protein [Candidatus Bathyarchaeia archaeon]